MAMYNVNREVQDAFYRYKMPAIIAKVITLLSFVLLHLSYFNTNTGKFKCNFV